MGDSIYIFTFSSTMHGINHSTIISADGSRQIKIIIIFLNTFHKTNSKHVSLTTQPHLHARNFNLDCSLDRYYPGHLQIPLFIQEAYCVFVNRIFLSLFFFRSILRNQYLEKISRIICLKDFQQVIPVRSPPNKSFLRSRVCRLAIPVVDHQIR